MIRITSLCRVFNCLPGPGGLLQQDYGLIDSMTMVIAAMNEREELEQKRGARNQGT